MLQGKVEAQVRVLATLCNLVAVESNADVAVECGLLVRVIAMSGSPSALLLQYLLITMRIVSDQERLKLSFVQVAVPFCVYRGTSLIRNCAHLGPDSRTIPRAIWWP